MRHRLERYGAGPPHGALRLAHPRRSLGAIAEEVGRPLSVRARQDRRRRPRRSPDRRAPAGTAPGPTLAAQAASGVFKSASLRAPARAAPHYADYEGTSFRAPIASGFLPRGEPVRRGAKRRGLLESPRRRWCTRPPSKCGPPYFSRHFRVLTRRPRRRPLRPQPRPAALGACRVRSRLPGRDGRDRHRAGGDGEPLGGAQYTLELPRLAPERVAGAAFIGPMFPYTLSHCRSCYTRGSPRLLFSDPRPCTARGGA